MGISDLPLGRRQLSLLAAAVAAAITAPRRATATLRTDRPGTAGRRRRLRPEPGSVDALDLPIAALPGVARRGDGIRTPVIETTRFSVLGVTWRRGRGRVRARWRREHGGWTGWRDLHELHHGPNLGTAEARGTPPATDLTWAGPCDAVQVELTGDHRDPVLALIHPRRRTTDAVADELASEPEPRALAAGRVPKPRMLHRRAWGADPSLRNGGPWYNRRIRQVHIHHTVNANDYSRADVPALIRAMYRYHTRSLGWSDIGYNFLVDRFERIWVGRAGGPRRAVRGAHTLGFNHASVGVAVIGNFENRWPNRRILRALTRVASWKLDLYDGRPRKRIWIKSGGSDRFREGELVNLPTIDGHRDTNHTACPGRHLYAALPQIRRRSARRIRRFHA